MAFTSLSTTDYSVSNITSSGLGISGVILFIVGLLGLFFSLKRKPN